MPLRTRADTRDGEDAASWTDGRNQRRPTRFGRLRLLSIALATLGIFALDTFTTMSTAIAVLYVLVLVSVSNSRTRPELWWLSSGCVALTLVSFLLDHDLTVDTDATLRLSFSITVILTVTVLLVRNLEDRQRYEAQALLLDATADAIVLRDLNGKVLLWNHGAEILYGIPREAMLGRIHHDVLQSGFLSPFALIEAVLLEQDAWNGEIEQVRLDGEVLAVASRWTLQRDRQGHPWAVLETSTDITARRAADRALLLSERRYRSIFDTLAVAVLEYDFTAVADMRSTVQTEVPSILPLSSETRAATLATARDAIRVVNANPRALELMETLCREHLLQQHCEFLPLNDEDLEACLTALQTGGVLFERELTTPGPGGKPLTLAVALHLPPAGEPVDRVQCSMVDLTEHRRMSDDLARMRSALDHASRLTTIGEISATIAHEVNQPLAAILTNAAAAQRWLIRGADQEAITALKEVALAAGHAGDVVKGVRRLLNRSNREDVPILVDDMIIDVMPLLKREAEDGRTEIALDLAAGGALVTGDRLLLQQAVLNLATNAIQAMQAMDAGRRISISTSSSTSTVVVSVRDTGPGFSEEMITDAWEGFAGTRSGGVGLGLAICRSAVEAHAGGVRIANAATGGALVEITLPKSV